MPRCFLSVKIPEEISSSISKIIPRLAGANLKIMPPQNYHFTLKFLGDRTEHELATLTDLLQPTLQSHPAFQATAHSTGAFPSKERPRIIWVGLSEGRNTYVSLQKSVEDALSPLQIRKESSYVPHLTIARVKAVYDRKKFAQFFENTTTQQFGTFQINSISLMKSVLTPQGPTYSDLKKFLLPSAL